AALGRVGDATPDGRGRGPLGQDPNVQLPPGPADGSPDRHGPAPPARSDAGRPRPAHRRPDHDRPGGTPANARRRARMTSRPAHAAQTRRTPRTAEAAATTAAGDEADIRWFPPPEPVIVPATDLGSVVTLKHGNLFLLSDPFGDVHADSRGLGL